MTEIRYEGEHNAKVLAMIEDVSKLRNAAIENITKRFEQIPGPYAYEIRQAERDGRDPVVVRHHYFQMEIRLVTAPYNRILADLHNLLIPTYIISKEKSL